MIRLRADAAEIQGLAQAQAQRQQPFTGIASQWSVERSERRDGTEPARSARPGQSAPCGIGRTDRRANAHAIQAAGHASAAGGRGGGGELCGDRPRRRRGL